MKLLDDLAVTETPTEASRRRFLGLLTAGSLGAALAGSLAVCVRYLWPSVLFELPSRFRAARVADLGRKRILFDRERRLYVVHDQEGVFAQSAVCTHLGCLTRPNPREDGFFCPCHGSRFALDGRVLEGPAPQPLPHYHMERREDDLWVDLARRGEIGDRIQV